MVGDVSSHLLIFLSSSGTHCPACSCSARRRRHTAAAAAAVIVSFEEAVHVDEGR